MPDTQNCFNYDFSNNCPASLKTPRPDLQPRHFNADVNIRKVTISTTNEIVNDCCPSLLEACILYVTFWELPKPNYITWWLSMLGVVLVRFISSALGSTCSVRTIEGQISTWWTRISHPYRMIFWKKRNIKRKFPDVDLYLRRYLTFRTFAINGGWGGPNSGRPGALCRPT